MKKQISQNNITNADNKEFITRQMKESVKHCYQNDLYFPALTLICSYIDGLGEGNKKDYLKNLQTHFPELCTQLGALTFYQKYRNGIIHEFCMKPDFALDRNQSMNGQYIQEYVVSETSQKLTALNIDKLVEDFINWVNKERNNGA